MSRRRSAGRWAALFLLGIAGLNVAAGAAEPAVDHLASEGNPGSSLRARDMLASAHPDIVFMGSSRVAFGLDPALAEREIERTTGRRTTAMNVGVFGSDVDVSYLILKNLIGDGARPGVIVYGISDYELNSDVLPAGREREEQLAPLVSYDDVGDFGGSSPLDKLSFLARQAFPIVRDHTLVHRDLGMEGLGLDPAVTRLSFGPTREGFFDGLSGRFSPGAWVNPELIGSESIRHYRVEGPRLDRMHDLLGLAQARGIRVVLVNMPVTALHRTYWDSPAQLQRFVATVRSVARQYDVPLLDLYQDPMHCIPADGFLDSHHLNSLGARALTSILTSEFLVPEFRRADR